jgi:hypothetical protein
MAAFEVLALDPAIPQIRAPGAADTYSHPRQSLFLAGTAALPGIAENSDADTGMWWPAGNTLAWSVNGGEILRLNATGLMIGPTATNPLQLLHVRAASAAAAPTILVNEAAGAYEVRLGVDTANTGWVGSVNSTNFAVKTSGTIRLWFPFGGGVAVGITALATNATNGFLYVPACAGTPTGTPTSNTGTAPIVVDTTNNKLYFYSGGAWRDAGP